MSRLPIPFRRKQTPLERAIDLGAGALQLWATTRVAKAAGSKLPAAAGAVGLGALALKALRSRRRQTADTPPPYASPPLPDDRLRTKPHGDPATDLPAPGRETAPPAGVAGASTAEPRDAGDGD